MEWKLKERGEENREKLRLLSSFSFSFPLFPAFSYHFSHLSLSAVLLFRTLYSSLRLIVVDASCCRFITNLLFSCQRTISSSLPLPCPVQLVARPNSILFCVKINPFEVGIEKANAFSIFFTKWFIFLQQSTVFM